MINDIMSACLWLLRSTLCWSHATPSSCSVKQQHKRPPWPSHALSSLLSRDGGDKFLARVIPSQPHPAPSSRTEKALPVAWGDAWGAMPRTSSSASRNCASLLAAGQTCPPGHLRVVDQGREGIARVLNVGLKIDGTCRCIPVVARGLKSTSTSYNQCTMRIHKMIYRVVRS